jgi:hypothetical protein
MNKLIINQAAALTITMGASGNTGLPHTQASVACGVLIKILNKLYKDDKNIRTTKNTVNKYMADLRPTSQTGNWS